MTEMSYAHRITLLLLLKPVQSIILERFRHIEFADFRSSALFLLVQRDENENENLRRAQIEKQSLSEVGASSV